MCKGSSGCPGFIMYMLFVQLHWPGPLFTFDYVGKPVSSGLIECNSCVLASPLHFALIICPIE